MKKLIYILLAFVVFLSFTAVNVFAGEVDKAKEAEKIFEKTVESIDNDLNIDAKLVSDDEMKSVVGEGRNFTLLNPGCKQFGDDGRLSIVFKIANYIHLFGHKPNSEKITLTFSLIHIGFTGIDLGSISISNEKIGYSYQEAKEIAIKLVYGK